MSNQNAQHALDKVKINLLSINGSPFLATILFGLKVKFDNSIPTLATSGIELLINPDFFLSIPEEQRRAEVAHECWHVALDHIGRLYDRDHDRWNRATDYAINIMMQDSGKYQLGNDWLLDPQYRGMTADTIYNLLEQQDKKSGGSPKGNQHMFKPNGDDGQPLPQSVAQAQVQKLVSKAAAIAQQAKENFGYVPGGLEFMLEPILKPKLNWKAILMNYVSTFIKSDYSYRRFNRRYLPHFYLPTLYSEAIGEIGVAFDASCSVSDTEFRIMMGQVKQIHQMLQPEKTELITFDTEVQTVHKLNFASPLNKLTFKGRGGTCVKCIFKHFDKRKPKVLIIFSDMQFYMPDIKPKYPVIWIGVRDTRINKSVPFGKYIELVE
ncbi:MAG: DUF2201 family putative metallopeptidase [Acinetobacter junii]